MERMRGCLGSSGGGHSSREPSAAVKEDACVHGGREKSKAEIKVLSRTFLLCNIV